MHRRQYLPDGRVNHYDIIRFRSLAARIERQHAAQVVELIHKVKTLRSGTTSYAGVREAFDAYTAKLGFFRRWKLRAEVFFARVMRWLKGETAYQPKLRAAA